MFIDYESPKTISKTIWFLGQTEERKKFTLVATWDEWDDWTANASDIMWDGEEGSEDEAQEAVHEFLTQMNS
jgi:hypothetical protein